MSCISLTSTALYYPTSILIFEWFVERRGLATGIMFAGSGAGGVAFPIIVSALLNRFSYRTTMISIGIGFGLLAGVASLGVKRRVPVARELGPGPRGRRLFSPNLGFCRHRRFVIGSMVILSTSLGFFVPTLWLPSEPPHHPVGAAHVSAYVDDLQSHKISGATLVAVMNGTSPSRLSCVPLMPL